MMRPVTYRWEDGKMVPLDRHATLCRRQFVDGTEYTLEPVTARNMNAHRGYFAEIKSIWLNLPDAVRKRPNENGVLTNEEKWPTEDHFRKWALVQTGYCKKRYYVCDSRKRALDLAAIIREIDEFAVMRIEGSILEIYEPKSQSMEPPPRGMSPEEFMKSKKDVLDLCTSLVPGWSSNAWRNSAKASRDRPDKQVESISARAIEHRKEQT